VVSNQQGLGSGRGGGYILMKHLR